MGPIQSRHWAHMVPASLHTPGSMTISTIIPVQVQGGPRAELKHGSPSPRLIPQATYITYWTPHTMKGGGGSVFFLCFHSRGCLWAHQRTTLACANLLQTLLLIVGVCLCMVNAYMRGVRRCVGMGVRAYCHAYDEI